jgi:hypothetical protein
MLDIVISGVGSLQDWEGTIMEFYSWGKVAPHCSLLGSRWSNWYARCNAGIAGFQHISRCLSSVLLYDKWLQKLPRASVGMGERKQSFTCSNEF